jgi:hypothetical protein
MAGLIVAPLFLLIIALAVFAIAGKWKCLSKAGRPGWGALIPIYNAYLLITVAGKPGWWLLLYCIPLVNIVFVILTLIGFARAFGQSGGFAIVLFLFPFVGFPILGFGEANYVGPQS